MAAYLYNESKNKEHFYHMGACHLESKLPWYVNLTPGFNTRTAGGVFTPSGFFAVTKKTVKLRL